MRSKLHAARWYLVGVAVVCLIAGAVLLLWPRPSPDDRMVGGAAGSEEEDALFDRLQEQADALAGARPEYLDVTVNPGADLVALAARQGLPPGAVVPSGVDGIVNVLIPDQVEPQALADALSRDPDVTSATVPAAEVTHVLRTECDRPQFGGKKRKDEPNDPCFPLDDDDVKPGKRQWGLWAMRPEIGWNDPRVQQVDPNLTLAVIDSGVDPAHKDLVVARSDPQGQASKTTGTCDNHGTHVAGIAGAVTNNELQIASPAWNQPVLDLAVPVGKRCDKVPTQTTTFRMAQVNAIAGLARGSEGWIKNPLKAGNRVIANNSWGRINTNDCKDRKRNGAGKVVKNYCISETSSFTAVEADILRAGFESGQVLWVFSSGNDRWFGVDDVGFPAKLPYVLSVGNVGRDLQQADSSQGGPSLDVVAPGTGIVSTLPGNKIGLLDGTSMAAPYVSGMAAAIWKAEPLLTSQQVMKRVMASTGNSKRNDDVGYGLIDMKRAFELDDTPPNVEFSQIATDPGAPLKFKVRAHDDFATFGLAPIDETIKLTEGGTDSFRLDFGEIPTSAVDAVRYSVDGGPWKDLAFPRDGVQRVFKDADGFPCQVCMEIEVPLSELGMVPEHRIVLRAYDSSYRKPDSRKFTEVQVTFRSESATERAVGSATTLVMDTSGSMDESFSLGSKMEAAKAAALDVADMIDQTESLGGANRIGLVTFANTAEVKAPPEPKADRAQAEIAQLSSGGGTDIGEGLRQGLSTLSGAKGSRSLILMSDGLPTSGLDKDGILSGPVAEAKRDKIPIYTVLLGTPSQSDADFMTQVAETTGGQFSVADTPNTLKTQFLKAEHRTSGEVLTETVASEVPLEVPRFAGILRVSALSSDGAVPAVVLTSPGGTDLVGSVELGSTGTNASTTITVPDPSAGKWTARSTTPVLFIVSAQPRPSPPTLADLNPPRDLNPPAGTALGPPDVVRVGPNRFATIGWAMLGAGAIFGLLGLLTVLLPVPTPADGRPPSFTQRHRRGVQATATSLLAVGLVTVAIVLLLQGIRLGVSTETVAPPKTAATSPPTTAATQATALVRVGDVDDCASVRAEPDPGSTEVSCVTGGLLLGFSGEVRNSADGAAWNYVNDPATGRWGWITAAQVQAVD